jgi:hypothetical protein
MSNSTGNTVAGAIHTLDKIQRVTRLILHVTFSLALGVIIVFDGFMKHSYSPANDDPIFTGLAFAGFALALIAAMEIGSTLNLTGYGNPMGAFNVVFTILFATVFGGAILMIFGSILTLDGVLPPEYDQYLHVYYGFEALGASILAVAGLVAVMMIIIETVERYWPDRSPKQPLHNGSHA